MLSVFDDSDCELSDDPSHNGEDPNVLLGEFDIFFEGTELLPRGQHAASSSTSLKRKVGEIGSDDESATPHASLQAILKAHSQICAAYNEQDMKKVRSIVDSVCDENCIVVTSIGEELVGRHHLADIWETTIDSFPDGLLVTKPSKIMEDGSVLTTGYFSGTRLKEGEWRQYMKLPDDDPEFIRIMKQIQERGSMPRIFRKGKIVFHLNPEKTKIIRWIKSTRVMEVSEQVICP